MPAFKSLNSKPWAPAHTGKGAASRRRPLDPRAFCRWKIEAAQGWNGRVSAALVIAAKCRRLGGPLSSGLEPLVSNHSLGVTSERDLLAFMSCRFSGFLDLLLLLSEEKAGMRSGLKSC